MTSIENWRQQALNNPLKVFVIISSMIEKEKAKKDGDISEIKKMQNLQKTILKLIELNSSCN